METKVCDEESLFLPVTSVKIPIQEILGKNKGEFLDVMIGEVSSPDKFYIQMKQSNSTYDLDDLVDEMDEVYSCEKADSRLKIQPQDLKIGLHCVAKPLPDDRWYRAVVLELGVLDSFLVFLLDFGGQYRLLRTELRWLMSKFCSLPAQALPARLVGISPPLGKWNWPDKSCRRLLDLTKLACNREEGLPRGLVARLDGWEAGMLGVRLIDTVTNTLEEGVDLANVLVEEGLARELCNDQKSSMAVEVSAPGLGESGDLSQIKDGLSNKESNKVDNNIMGGNMKCVKLVKLESSSPVIGPHEEGESPVAQLKNLLNVQNEIHCLVGKIMNTRDRETVEMWEDTSKLQECYQKSVSKLITRLSKDFVHKINEESQKEDIIRDHDDVVKLNLDTEKVAKKIVVKRKINSTLIPPENGTSNKIYTITNDTLESSGESIKKDINNNDIDNVKPCRVMKLSKSRDQVLKSVEVSVYDLELDEKKVIHPILMENNFMVTSTEVSHLNNQWVGYNLLTRMLNKRNADFFSLFISPRDFPELHQAGVDGLERRSGDMFDKVELYKLSDVPDLMKCLKVEVSEEVKRKMHLFLINKQL